LCPHEVDLFDVLFVVELPPEARLKQGAHHDGVVPLADVELVVAIAFGLYLLYPFWHRSYIGCGVHVIRPFEDLVTSKLINILVFLLHDSANKLDQLFFYRVGVLPDLQELHG